MKINLGTDLTKEMKDFIKSEYSSPDKDIQFYFCGISEAKGFYKISRTSKGVNISNGKTSKEWAANSSHKFMPVGQPALNILKDKNSVTFHYDESVERYNIYQPDLTINGLNLMIKSID